MIESLLIGIGGVIILMVIWIVVQTLWRKTFANYISESDVLAERSSCGSCNCTTACTQKTITT